MQIGVAQEQYNGQKMGSESWFHLRTCLFFTKSVLASSSEKQEKGYCSSYGGAHSDISSRKSLPFSCKECGYLTALPGSASALLFPGSLQLMTKHRGIGPSHFCPTRTPLPGSPCVFPTGLAEAVRSALWSETLPAPNSAPP